jgi:hypothetical protein
MRGVTIGVVGCVALVAALRADEGKKAAVTADPQFVESDDWFFFPYPEESMSKRGRVMLGKRIKESSDEVKGAAVFHAADNHQYDAKRYFKCRPARPEELVVGRHVVYSANPIQSKSDKDEASWSYRQIVDLVDAPKGQLIVAGTDNPVVDRAGLRVLVGENDPTIALTGREDAQHFHPEHWLVFTGASAPDADGHDTKMALAIKAPAKKGEEGTFLVLSSGEIVTTRWAYRSHVATRGELRKGLRVAKFTVAGDPPSREGAYAEPWYVGDLGEVTPGVIRMENGSVRLEALRVVE